MVKILKVFMVTFLAYLIQVCVMPYLPIGRITANLLIGVIAVVTVAYGRFFAFGAGAVCGILMEIMIASIDYLYLLIYPVLGFMGSLLFADKSERKLEQERSIGKKGKNLPAVLRTILCAAMNIAIYELVNLTYTYLTGVDLTLTHLARSLISILYTIGVTMCVMLPLRRFFGVWRRRITAGTN